MAICFLIKQIISKNVAITSNAEIDYYIYFSITVILLFFTLKSFIQSFIGDKDKKEKDNVSSAIQNLVMYVALCVVAVCIWYVMNWVYFYIIFACFVLAYIIVYALKYREKEVIRKESKKVKEVVYKLYNIKVRHIKGIECTYGKTKQEDNKNNDVFNKKIFSFQDKKKSYFLLVFKENDKIAKNFLEIVSKTDFVLLKDEFECICNVKCLVLTFKNYEKTIERAFDKQKNVKKTKIYNYKKIVCKLYKDMLV